MMGRTESVGLFLAGKEGERVNPRGSHIEIEIEVSTRDLIGNYNAQFSRFSNFSCGQSTDRTFLLQKRACV